jgi:hypothetical protein
MSRFSAGATRSYEMLTQRVATISGELRSAIARDLAIDDIDVDNWWVTGAGGSEGPARVFVAALTAAGSCARFVPLSSFAGTVAPGDAVGLAIFSQGLSPNATLSLGVRDRFASTLLFSASACDGVQLVAHGPAEEPGMLVRVVGPALATLAAIRAAAAIAKHDIDLQPLLDVIDAGLNGPVPAPVNGPVALVTAGAHANMAHGLRWKLLEALGTPDPPIWDVLQVAHGPFQQFYDGPMTLITVEHTSERALFDRLASILVDGRHRLIRLCARLPSPLSWFEHDAQLNQIVLATLREQPRDLIDWPGKGFDAALYGLSKPLTTAD